MHFTTANTLRDTCKKQTFFSFFAVELDSEWASQQPVKVFPSNFIAMPNRKILIHVKVFSYQRYTEPQRRDT